MKVLVIGLGSMGKRRIRLLKNVFNIQQISGIDLNRERRSAIEAEFSVTTFKSIEIALSKDKFDVAFICTAPVSHATLIKACLSSGIHVFSEINLVDDEYSEIMELAGKNKKKIFLSSTPMYRKEIQYISNKVKTEKEPINYIYHVGQYLPDWHPWESYNDYFVNDKRTNGCREIFAIELPWMIRAFGDVGNTIVIKGKNTKLNINYNDHYFVNFEHSNGNKGVFIVDLISRRAVRQLEIVSENLYLQWGGTPESLCEYDFNEKGLINRNTYEKINRLCQYSENIIEDMYCDEMRCFFDYLSGECEPLHTIENDLRVLKLIDIIEGV